MYLGNIIKAGRYVDTGLRRKLSAIRRVLINARTPMNYAVMAPLPRAMRHDSRVEFFFMSSERPGEALAIFREAGSSARLTTPRRSCFMKFDAYLAADWLWTPLLRGAPRIQMFHGVAGKYADLYDKPDQSVRDWDRLFFINGRRLRNFIAAGAIDDTDSAARLIGMPKLDCLVNGSLQRSEVLTALHIDPGRTTVLYAPTWSPYSSLNVMGEELVKRLCAAGYAVMVKLHDRSRDQEWIHSGGIDWFARLKPVLDRYDGLLADGSDASPYLAAADVLITDHSSVGFEYLLLDRPVIRIEMPDLISATRTNPEYVALLADASTTVTNTGEAISAVERCLADPSRMSATRKSVVKELFHEPGNATARAVRELYEIIELEPLNCGKSVQCPA